MCDRAPAREWRHPRAATLRAWRRYVSRRFLFRGGVLARGLIERARRCVDDRVLVAGAERPGVGELASNANECGAGPEVGGDFLDGDPAGGSERRIRTHRLQGLHVGLHLWGHVRRPRPAWAATRADTPRAPVLSWMRKSTAIMAAGTSQPIHFPGRYYGSYQASLRLGGRSLRARYSSANFRFNSPPGSSGMRRSHCS